MVLKSIHFNYFCIKTLFKCLFEKIKFVSIVFYLCVLWSEILFVIFAPPPCDLFPYCSFAHWKVSIWPCLTKVALKAVFRKYTKKNTQNWWHKVALRFTTTENTHTFHILKKIFALPLHTFIVTHCHTMLGNTVLKAYYYVYCPILVLETSAMELKAFLDKIPGHMRIQSKFQLASSFEFKMVT